MTDMVALFNPRPRILRQDFPNGQFCLIIDDALLRPEQLRQYAADHRAEFIYAGLAAGLDRRSHDRSPDAQRVLHL